MECKQGELRKLLAQADPEVNTIFKRGKRNFFLYMHGVKYKTQIEYETKFIQNEKITTSITTFQLN